MSWQTKKGLLYETHLAGIPWLKHFFTLRVNGNLRDQEILKRTCEKEKITPLSVVSAEQVHGDKIFLVKKGHLGKRISSVDALLTDCLNIPLIIFTADCLPIFFVERKRKITGLVHAGRKGTIQGIVYKTVKIIENEYNFSPDNLIAAIGPHVHSCCYPVNLTRLNFEQLLSAGVKRENIFISRYCTSCRNDLFFSYHLEKEKAGRMMSLIMAS